MRELLRNETIQTLILMAIIVAGFAAFWFGLRFALRTGYPLLAVASDSMEPTLNVGDLIIVQGGLDPHDIVADWAPNGTIIVFHKPGEWDTLIVHRAVQKNQQGDGSYYFKTKGDKSWYSGQGTNTDPWDVKETDIVGRVVGKVPWIGYVPLFMREVAFPFLLTPLGFIIVVLVIIGVILSDYFLVRKKQAEA